MTRDEVVQGCLKAIEDGQKEVVSGQLGAAYDAGEAVGNGPGFTQADIDAAVAKAQSDDQAVLAGVQQQLVDMTQKEQMEEGQVATLTDIVNKIKALLAP